jgi:hypothetical protein
MEGVKIRITLNNGTIKESWYAKGYANQIFVTWAGWERTVATIEVMEFGTVELINKENDNGKKESTAVRR